MTTTIYMFHAIGEICEADWADPHYSFDIDKFHDFLRHVKSVTSIKDKLSGVSDSNIIITFDDGHISNYDAAKFLYDNKIGTADFFINPLHVGKDFYMSWDQLRELSEMGMSVQSHGLDHQFLSDCDDSELKKQLLQSKKIIEDNLSNEVTILAPPGGRFDNRTLKFAQEFGYKCVANSIPGHASNIHNFKLPRMAVLKHHSIDDLLGFTSIFSRSILKQKIQYQVLYILKSILGNKNYEKLRWKAMSMKS